MTSQQRAEQNDQSVVNIRKSKHDDVAIVQSKTKNCDALIPHPSVIVELQTIEITKCGVICHDRSTDRYLMVRQKDGHQYFGWPKGEKNRNETLIDCAGREWKEETGCGRNDSNNVMTKSTLQMSTSFYCINYPSLIYLVSIPSSSAISIDLTNNSEISDYRWFSLDELIQLTFVKRFWKCVSIFTKHINCLLFKQLGYTLNGYKPMLMSYSIVNYSKQFTTFLRNQEQYYLKHKKLAKNTTTDCF